MLQRLKNSTIVYENFRYARSFSSRIFGFCVHKQNVVQKIISGTFHCSARFNIMGRVHVRRSDDYHELGSMKNYNSSYNNADYSLRCWSPSKLHASVTS